MELTKKQDGFLLPKAMFFQRQLSEDSPESIGEKYNNNIVFLWALKSCLDWFGNELS